MNFPSSLPKTSKPVVFVAGGAGFIGSNFVRKLLTNNDCKIVNFDSLSYAGNIESISDILDLPDHNFIVGDITDRKHLLKIFNKFHPDIVVNFAAESHVDRSIDDPDPFIQSNIMGAYELLEAARFYLKKTPSKKKNFRFIQVSTDEVFGELGEKGMFHEDSQYNPSSPYSASKAAADHLVQAYYRTYALPVLITHCSNNYGPYQYPEKLIPVIISNAIEGKKIPIYGDGKNVRDWLFVDDHCDAILTVMHKGLLGEKYCIGGGCEKTNIEVALSICNILDDLYPNSKFYPHRNLIEYVEDRAGHDRRYAIDASKISKSLNWKAKENFETGLKKTVDWYLQNENWCEAVVKTQVERLEVKKLA